MGIKQEKGTAGYSSLVIQPLAFTEFGYMSGSIETPRGAVSVKYRKITDHYGFKVFIPKGVKAVFKIDDGNLTDLSEGENSMTVAG